MVLEEDTSTNRLLESLKLWKALTSSQFFKGTPFILFLNKSDLFQEKIAKVPLGDIFSDFDQVAASPEFANFNTFEKSWQYILKQFRSHFEGYTFYPHLTNVLDTELCKKVFVVVQDTVVKETLKQSSLI
jgi:guanine nucleotide-binding protein subunit alpha